MHDNGRSLPILRKLEVLIAIHEPLGFCEWCVLDSNILRMKVWRDWMVVLYHNLKFVEFCYGLEFELFDEFLLSVYPRGCTMLNMYNYT